MKRLIFSLAALVCLTVAANAQFRPEGLSFTTELSYTPITGGDEKVNKLGTPEYGIKLRTFLNEKYAVRLNLGFSSTAATARGYYLGANDAEFSTFSRGNSTLFTIAPGFEYHFTKFERVFPYVGCEIGFGAGTSGSKSWNDENKDYRLSKKPTFSFGIAAVSGVDVYICKGFYAGFELGLGYRMDRTGRGETAISSGSTITKEEGTGSSTTNKFGFFAVPSLRIGWHF